MKHKVHFSTLTDEWKTPESLFNKLNKEFEFNFDPCPLAKSFDGLKIDWGLRNFCNPPYSQLKAWCKKGYEEYLKGKLVVMLIPSRTDTIAWHDYCMKATEIRFIKGRVKFGNSKNSAPFPSAIVIFRPPHPGEWLNFLETVLDGNKARINQLKEFLNKEA